MAALTPESDGETPRPTETFPVVGIGASAGGITAFQTFLDRTPPDSGMAFVLIQHLDPERESHLAEVMARHTRMPVRRAEEGMAIEPNVVYVIPPNAELTVRDGSLRVARPKQPRGQRTPIDAFFLSLAEKRGEDAIGVVLSGAGHDGTIGLRAVKEQGGFVLAQAVSPDDRMSIASMPRSAVETGLVDDVLPVEEMPARLLAYVRHRARLLAAGERAAGTQAATASQLPAVCALLHRATGHDLSQYKDKTLIRRVARRMQVLQIDDAAAYVERLHQDSGEVDRLFQDLLIGVTHFFRDPEAFDALAETAIPDILARNDGTDAPAVRVWVPGCATGEEAYSIAILLREAADHLQRPPRVQVFATDISEPALRAARTGEYAPSIAADLRPDRLHRFFISDGKTCRVVKEIRNMCVFSLHNVIRDPPFSRLDLISCRNLLIYLSADLQRRLIPVFHYALEAGGYLFLGSSENVTQHGELFEAVDKRHRIFRNREKAGRRAALEFPLAARGLRPAGPSAGPARGGRTAADRDEAEAAARVIMDEFAPAYVIVDGRANVVRFSSERTGRYLTPPAGAPSTGLLDMARRGLRLDLRAALQRAVQRAETVVHERVAVTVNGGVQPIRLTVRPLVPGKGENGRYLVVFQDIGPVQTGGGGGEAAATGAGGAVEDAHVQRLEDELRTTRDHLQTTIEELESANEELQSVNEDLLSANEELQSANEELETSKEELESANEELHTVNTELNLKVDELAAANNDLKNLVESTQLALVFLDRELRVKSFTPAVTDLFHLIKADVGRPLAHITGRLDHPELQAEARRVIETHEAIEREVVVPETGAGYIMRIVPYRTVANAVEGAVIAFVDITERKRDEEQRARLAAIVAASDDAIIGATPDGAVTAWNAGAERLYGYAAAEALGRPISFLTPKDRAEEDRRIFAAVAAGNRVNQLDTVRLCRDGRPVDVSLTVSPVKDRRNEVIAASVVARDITERKRAEEHQRLLLAELNHRVKNTLAIVQAIAVQTLNQYESLEAFGEAFVERLRGLGDTHSLLSRTNWEGAGLRDLVLQGLAAYRARDGDRVTVTGEPIVVTPGAALSLAMVLHELATNASKYGALSAPSGRVEVRWHVRDRDDGGDRQRWLSLQWTESGGPEVREPPKRGFGLRFIERSVAYELYGTADINFAPGGLTCTIGLPLAGVVVERGT